MPHWTFFTDRSSRMRFILTGTAMLALASMGLLVAEPAELVRVSR